MSAIKDTATQVGQVRDRLQIRYIMILLNFFLYACKSDHKEET